MKIKKIILLAFLAVILLLSVACYYLFPSNKRIFIEETGLLWPNTAKVVGEYNYITGPFDCDGLSIIWVDIGNQDEFHWLSEKPFENDSNWQLDSSLSDLPKHIPI